MKFGLKVGKVGEFDEEVLDTHVGFVASISRIFQLLSGVHKSSLSQYSDGAKLQYELDAVLLVVWAP